MRRLLSVERHQKILERVASENAVDFASLADELGVSSMTVRRDLHILEEAGYLKTTRGGASAQLVHSHDLLLHPRAMDQTLAKTQIGQYAASLIEKGEVIFLGTGSTTAVFAQFFVQTMRYASNGIFGSGIATALHYAIETGDRGDIDDMASLFGFEVRNNCSRAVHQAMHIGSKHGMPLFQR